LFSSLIRIILAVLICGLSAYIFYYSFGLLNAPPYDLFNFFWLFGLFTILPKWGKMCRVHRESWLMLFIFSFLLLAFFVCLMFFVEADLGSMHFFGTILIIMLVYSPIVYFTA